MRKIGVDEVGRGCLAGDLIVVAYSFCDEKLSRNPEILDLCKDSKAFSSRKKREAAFSQIETVGTYVLIRKSPADIERLNIRGAVLEAFAQSAEKLAQTLSEPVACYFDGRDLPINLKLPSGSSSEAVIKGDAKIPEISAASVIAKVIRDKEMEELSLKFPDYDWAKNAGYGTKAHIEALRAHGLTPHHRESWVRKFL